MEVMDKKNASPLYYRPNNRLQLPEPNHFQIDYFIMHQVSLLTKQNHSDIQILELHIPYSKKQSVTRYRRLTVLD